MKPSPALILDIKWAEADERIRVDASNLSGDSAQPWVQPTVEEWKGREEAVLYYPKASYVAKSRTLELEYRESDHQGLPPGIPWGKSIITFAADFRSAEVKFEGDKDDGSTGEARRVKLREESPSEKRQQFVAVRIAQAAFRNRLLRHYDRCALTGDPTRVLLEAAHVHEVRSGGSDEFENGLLLRVDIHRLFDHGYININPDGTVLQSDKVPPAIGQRIKRLDPEILSRIKSHLKKRPPGLREEAD